MQAEIRVLRDANTALSKHQRVKRTCLQDGEVLTGLPAKEIITGWGLIEEGGCDEGTGEGSPKRHQIGIRLCSKCCKTGHNARTCPEAEEIANLSISNNNN
jgi:hypothetical protein